MSAATKPHSGTKESGLPWVPDGVPNRWQLIPNRALLKRQKVLVGDSHSEYRLLSLTKQGVIVRDLDDGGKFSSDLGTSQVVQRGNFVFCLFDVPETPRTVGLSRHDGMITGAYTIMECRDSRLARFLEYFYLAMDDRKLLAPLYSGLRNTIPVSRFLAIKTPLPPCSEQDSIVAFLDNRLANIDQFVANKRRLIDVLEEQFSREVDRVTCKGIDDASVEDSGIDWIGKVPKHWMIAPLKYAFTSIEYGISDSGSDDGVIPVLTMGHIKNGEVHVPESGGVQKIASSMLLHDGDLLFNRTNSAELVGKVGLFRHVGKDVTFASYLVRLRPKPSVDSEYMNYLLNSPRILGIARQLAIPSLHQSNLNPTRYGRVHVALPPHDEQIRLAAWLNDKRATFDEAKRQCKREIALMNEFRTSLIAEAVTGKIDVSKAKEVSHA